MHVSRAELPATILGEYEGRTMAAIARNLGLVTS